MFGWGFGNYGVLIGLHGLMLALKKFALWLCTTEELSQTLEKETREVEGMFW